MLSNKFWSVELEFKLHQNNCSYKGLHDVLTPLRWCPYMTLTLSIKHTIIICMETSSICMFYNVC